MCVAVLVMFDVQVAESTYSRPQPVTRTREKIRSRDQDGEPVRMVAMQLYGLLGKFNCSGPKSCSSLARPRSSMSVSARSNRTIAKHILPTQEAHFTRVSGLGNPVRDMLKKPGTVYRTPQ